MDTVTTKSTLQNVLGFADGDTRTINIDDPKDNLTAADVRAWVQFAIDNQLLLSDKSGAALTGVESSKIIDGSHTKVSM